MTSLYQRILVVDDLPDWRETLSGLLIDEGYDVEVAASSTKAVELLANSRFDLAVLDMRLDETDEDNTEGLDLAAKIRQYWPAVKVVIITGYGTRDALRRAREPDSKGHRLAEEFIPKTKTEQLAQVVQQVLSQ